MVWRGGSTPQRCAEAHRYKLNKMIGIKRQTKWYTDRANKLEAISNEINPSIIVIINCEVSKDLQEFLNWSRYLKDLVTKSTIIPVTAIDDEIKFIDVRPSASI